MKIKQLKCVHCVIFLIDTTVMRCLILLHPFTQSLFILLDLKNHKHVDKISMDCTFCILPLAMKCLATRL